MALEVDRRHRHAAPPHARSGVHPGGPPGDVHRPAGRREDVRGAVGRGRQVAARRTCTKGDETCAQILPDVRMFRGRCGAGGLGSDPGGLGPGPGADAFLPRCPSLWWARMTRTQGPLGVATRFFKDVSSPKVKDVMSGAGVPVSSRRRLQWPWVSAGRFGTVFSTMDLIGLVQDMNKKRQGDPRHVQCPGIVSASTWVVRPFLVLVGQRFTVRMEGQHP